MASPKYKDMRDGWEALMRGEHPFATKPKDEAPEVRHRPNKFKSHDHEAYAVLYRQDLDKRGGVHELAVDRADEFWPKEKLVPSGKGKLAPRPFDGNGERREYLRRLKSERGWTFQEV